MALNCSSKKNAKIIRVCMKLHNYCIRMKQKRGEGFVGRFEGNQPDPSSYGIIPLNDGGNRNSQFGFLESGMDEDEAGPPASAPSYSTLSPDPTRRAEIVADVVGRGLRRPASNVNRNN